MPDVLTLGETMVVFHPETTGPFRHVPSFRKSIGGAESNVAIGLARLGVSATWVSKVSDDALGEYVLSVIRGEGVDVSAALKVPDGFTGLMVKEQPPSGDPHVYFYRRGSAASTFQPDEFPYHLLSSTRILHLTGIFPALSATCRETARSVIRAAREAGVRISFDPNLRRKLWSSAEARPVLLELAAQSDYLLPGLDEAELMVGPGAPAELVARLLALGPELVVLKLGPTGALVAGRELSAPIRIETTPLPTVDTVGAGDSFAAGFLAGMVNGLPIWEAVRQAAIAGGLATQVAGDYEGLPFRSDLDYALGQGSRVAR
jgi:2-dehydro-3-deoxygluconokinase